ncbi:hypothetical protein F2P81_009673 [Scophthalmus maximus]|uniref:SOCS box domain-containing protein n=1 Tax=Scophthalmus maximus TaxID=52904 RepID=A0A6A4T2L8_SCOMX|nr:hypothetical protein F2P81_009673 [Scophthalmus maximus]
MEVTAARRAFLCDIGFWADRTALHEAAFHGRVLQLKQLIESAASVNTVTVDNITPLHEACTQGHVMCAQLLLEAGAQVDARNVDGSTPLCDACSCGSLECVRLLLDHGAKANPALTSRTASPLHEACMRGNSDCATLLIAVGACLESYDLYHGTPLHVACANEHTDCVKVLLNAGARVNAARLHETPLHRAAKSMRAEMIETLVEFGANVYARDQQDKKPVDYTAPGSPSAACLRFYETTPMSLQQLSRLAVRKTLGTRALQVTAACLPTDPNKAFESIIPWLQVGIQTCCRTLAGTCGSSQQPINMPRCGSSFDQNINPYKQPIRHFMKPALLIRRLKKQKTFADCSALLLPFKSIESENMRVLVSVACQPTLVNTNHEHMIHTSSENRPFPSQESNSRRLISVNLQLC